tara:strand:+ start:1576 stop:1758 length:183 start_codon:yes stop_codon:yes gene_type:complete
MKYTTDHPYYKAVKKVFDDNLMRVDDNLIEQILHSLFHNPVDIRKWTEEQLQAKGEMSFS